MKIIAFGHKRRTGKDTGARILMGELQLRYPRLVIRRKSFASKLKDISHQLYGWAGVREAMYYENNPHERQTIIPALGINVVDLWIIVGNLFRDHVYTDTWIRNAIAANEADILIFSDLRYPNEAKAVKDNNGLCIRVDRDEAPKSNDIADNALNDYNDWDYILDNNNGLPSYAKQIVQLARSI